MALGAVMLVSGVNSVMRSGLIGTKGADVYYDGVHCARHLWNRANKRHRVAYHTVSGFNRFYNALGEEGYNVHVETYKKFNRAILSGYDVFFIGEQTYHSRFMSEQERNDLLAWVKEDGGSLFTLIEHTDAHYMAEVFDELYKDLPVRVRRDSIGDIEQPGPLSPTWVDLSSNESHPTTKGVREYRFFNGASLDTPHGVLFSTGNSWSDRHNPDDRPIQNGNKRRDSDELGGPLVGAAAFTYGRGKVVVISDHNAMSNPTMYWGDHYRFVMNSMAWLAGQRLNLDVFFVLFGIIVLGAGIYLPSRRPNWFPGAKQSIPIMGALIAAVVIYQLASRPVVYDLFIHTGNDSDMKYMTKRSSGYFSLYGQWTKEPQLRPWASRKMKPGYDTLFLSAPKKPYSAEQLAIIDGYLGAGKIVVYLASKGSIASPAGEQLMKRFDFTVAIEENVTPKGRRSFNVYGPRAWTEGIFRAYIDKNFKAARVKKGLEPVVFITRGGFHIREKGWRNIKHQFDLLSEKRVGGGKLWVVMPIELFNDRTLKNLYSDADVVRQQMAEFVIRLAKLSVNDHSVYYED
jgi:hypothetical protein